jgi:hypothetical protein
MTVAQTLSLHAVNAPDDLGFPGPPRNRPGRVRMFVFEIFGGLDRDGPVIAVRAWLASTAI